MENYYEVEKDCYNLEKKMALHCHLIFSHTQTYKIHIHRRDGRGYKRFFLVLRHLMEH